MLTIVIPEKNTVKIVFGEDTETPQSVTFTGKSYQIWPTQPNGTTATSHILSRFFSILTPDESWALFTFYREAHDCIKLRGNENITKAVEDIKLLWQNVYFKHDVIQKAITLSMMMALPDNLSAVGDRPQDTDALTYRETDYYDIYAMSILGIVMTPVWTELLYRLSSAWSTVSTQDMQGERELVVFPILEPTFDDPRINAAYEKLCNYTQHSIDRGHDEINKGSTSTVATSLFLNNMANTSRERFSELCMASLMVRALIRFTFDFVDESSGAPANIMMKVITQVRTFVQQRTNMQRSDYRAREPLKSSNLSDTQRQNSACDLATVPISGMGTQAMLTPAFNMLVDKAMIQYGIDQGTVQQIRAYYEDNPFPRTAFNLFIITTGWRSILPPRAINDLMNSDYYTLVGITQLIFATTMNYGNQLIYLLSAKQDDVKQEGIKHPWYESIRIRSVNSEENKAFREITQCVSNRDSCVDNQIRNILDQVCIMNNYVNMPPCLDSLDTSVANGHQVPIDEEFLNQTMKMGVRLVLQELIECQKQPMALS